MLPHMREPKRCTEMATEKPTLPAPEEQVSPAAEDAQANPAVTVRVPEPEMPAAGPAAEASAAAEEPVAEVADAPAESAVTETPAARSVCRGCRSARRRNACGGGRRGADFRGRRLRRAPNVPGSSLPPGRRLRNRRRTRPGTCRWTLPMREAALAAQNAGLEIEGATPEEEAAEELAAQKPEEDKFAGKRRRSWWPCSPGCSKSSPCSRSAGMWRR